MGVLKADSFEHLTLVMFAPQGRCAMERRLAAILAADGVGYSRLMGEDEAGTLARLEGLRAESQTLSSPVATSFERKGAVQRNGSTFTFHRSGGCQGRSRAGDYPQGACGRTPIG